MAIPKWPEFRPFVLEALKDGKPHSKKEIADFVANALQVTPEERAIKIKGNHNVTLFGNYFGWACGSLAKAGKIQNPVENNKTQWDFYALSPNQTKESSTENTPDKTPQEVIAQAYSELNDKLAKDLLARIMDNSPVFFEGLVVDLLLGMGYGGADFEAGTVTHKSWDGGIDGVIKQDKLGFDRIYIQAKRWKPGSTVETPEIQKFYGALSGVKADRGLFITTAKFSKGAIDYANQQRIVLVDGERLTHLMIEYNVGVSTVAKYEIKAIDSDFFSDETA